MIRIFSPHLSPARFSASLFEMRIFVFCLCLVATACALGAELQINFGDFPEGNPPKQFVSTLAGEGTPGNWKILMDDVPSAFTPLTDKAPIVSRRAVLGQTSQDPTDERFPILIYDTDVFKDFKATVRFKLVSGAMEQMAGIVFRFQNASNFYVVRVSGLGKNIRFYKVVDGQRSAPIGPTLDIATGEWHTLAVQAQGNQISCWVDDKPAMPPLTDNTFVLGKIGLWTKSDAVSYFSDLDINYTPRIPVAQSLVDNTLQKQPRILGLRIYTLDEKGVPHVIASKDPAEIGQTGTDAEHDAITKGTVSFGRGKGTVAVTLPFTDRNGDPMAAVRLQLDSFIGETENNAVTRGRMIVRKLQEQVSNAQDLAQ